MATRQETANSVYRDYATDGVPTSGANEPSKAEIRAYESVCNRDLDAALQALATAGMVIKTTRSLLFADLAHADGTWGVVIADETADYNGFYEKDGASGSGDWGTKQGDLFFGSVSQSALDAEEAARIAADTAETAARSAADANLQTEIDAIADLPPGIEVALDIDTDPPLEWYDTGARIAAVPTTRAFLSNKRPIDMASTVHWVDFSDKSTLFQDAALSTPVENEGDSVYGFIAKDNVGTFLETVALTNPLFDTDLTGWTLASGSGGTAAWNAEKARVTRTTTVTSIEQSMALTGGRVYTITADATWISGASAQCSVVLRSGASASATSKAIKSLSAGASGQIVLTYVPSVDETVYLHLTCAGGAGVVDFDTIAVTAGNRAIFTAVDPTALGTWRVRHGKGYLAANEGSETKVGYVCSQIHGLGSSAFQGGVCIGYRQRKPQTGAFVWTSSLISGDGNTASLQSFVGTGDRFTVAGSGTVLADRGLRDKAAYLWWNRNLGTSRGGRTKETLSTVAIGSDSDDTSFYLFVRGSGSGAAVDVYDLTIIEGSITDEDRDWLCDYTNARANVRYPTQINVVLVWGQSNSDMRAALSDAAAPAGWNDDKILPGVWNWNGSEISDTYWFYPVGSTQCGGSWSDGQAGASKFGFIDVACAEIAETIPNLVVCRVTQGGTGVDTSTNTNGSWHVPSSALDEDTPSLFDALKNKFLALQTFCAEHAIRCNVIGGFYHQGENAKAYPSNFKVDTEALFAAVRDFVGDEDMPIVTGTIPTLSAYYSASVRADQLAIDTADDRCTYLDFSALTMSDGTHFDAASNVTAGGNAATEMLAYVGDSYLIPSGTGSIVGAGFPDLGNGVATALTQDIGSAGGLVAGGGALGTPASGNLENCADLPLSGISDFGSGVAAALAQPVRTLDARTFGVVGDPMTTARASLTDNTAALQSIITHVKALTPTSGLSSIQAEVPIMTVVDLPPGYVGVKAETVAWQEPHVFIPDSTTDNRVAVLLDCDNIVFRGNGTTIVHLDNADPAGYSYLFGTGYERTLTTGANPIQVWSGLRRCYVTCSVPHRLTAGDVIKIGGSMTTTSGVTFSALEGYQTVAAYPVTATKFYFFYDAAFDAANANGNIGSTTLTFTALRSVSGIGFIGDLTFNCSQPATITNGLDTAALFLNGANDVYIDAKFRSANASSFAGRGVRAYNSKRVVFSDRCMFDTMSQGLFFAYCGDIDFGDMSFRNVNESIDIQLACWNIRAGKLYGKFDADFQPEDTSRTQERQLIDVSDAHNVHIESIITERYYKPIFVYTKNEWSTYSGYLDNAGTLDNLDPWGCQDIYVGNVIATNDDAYASDFRMALLGWHQDSTIGLTPITNPFATTNGSSTVTYTNSVAHRLEVGDDIIFGGTIADVGGLTSGNIAGSRTVLAVPTPTTITFTAGASATSDATGGGSSVTAGMPNKGVANVPEPKNIRIGSYTSRGGGYVIIEAGDFSFGNLVLDDAPGTGAALRIGSQSVTDPDTGVVTKNGSVSVDRLAISNCAVGLTITGTPAVRFGDVIMPSTVTTPMSSISITAKLDKSSIRIGAVDAAAVATVDEPLLALGANEGVYVVQGWLSNVGAITANGTDYATAELVKVSSGGVATIGGSAINYGSGAINAGVMTALNGNGTDTDGLIGPDNVVAVRFTKQGAGKTYLGLTGKLSAIRWRTE